jgi:hypothetical protein
MANDIAQLGISIDSSNLKQATTALNDFAAAAKPAGDGASS